MLADTINKVKAIQFDSTNLNAYTASLRGLSETQARVVLSSSGLDKAQQKQILNNLNATKSTISLTSAEATEALTKRLGTQQAANDLLVKAKLITYEEIEKGVTIELTSELIKKKVALGLITQEEGEQLLAAFGLTGGNVGLATSFKLLGKQIGYATLEMAKWMVTNPVGQIALFVGILAGAKGIYNLFTTSVKEAQESLEEFNQTCSDLESASSELTSIDDKIKAIQDKGTLSLTDQSDLSRLEQERKLLEKEIELLELKKELTEEKSNSDAVKSVNDGTYKNGDGFFDRDVDDLINVIKTQPLYFDAYSESTRNNAKQAYADAKVELADLQRRNIELLGQITGDDEASVNARKELQEYIDYVNQYLYTAEELQKMKFDDFLGENENIKKAFDDLSNDGADVTAESIENLASKFPSLKTYMDENGISAETLAAEFAKTSSEAETAGKNVNEMTVSLSDSADKIKELNSILKELNDGGLSNDSIEKIISDYPELIGYIGDEVKLRTELKKKIAEEENKYKQALRNKVMASSSFAELVESKNQELFRELGLAYNKDTQKFELESRRKAAIAIKDATTAANAWAQIYADEQVLSAPDFSKDLHDAGKNSKYRDKDGNWHFETYNDGKLKTWVYKAGSSMAKILDSQRELSNISNFDIDFGDDSSSGSDKNEALDNYLKDAENRYKIHQDEVKYIEELQWAKDNLTKSDKERLEIAGKINEAYRDLADNRIKDLEHQNELLLAQGKVEYDLISNYRQMQDVLHKEAERLRSMGYDDNSNEIQDLQSKWLDYDKKILDADLGNSKKWIDERNRLGDWHLFKDDEVSAWERVVKWLKEDYPNAIEEIKEAEESLYEARKEQFEKATDFANSYLDSQKTLLQSHFDITNAIAEAQHEINKELEASKTMYEYLDEDTRKLLFNQEDYNTLSKKLIDIQSEANRLQKQYEYDLEHATLNTIEEITSNYEMQYETLMKSYEIAKADLEIAKKKQKLNNVLNEKNVKMLIDGQWKWVANTQDVIDAQKELADAEYAKQTAQAGLRQTESINELTKKQNKLGSIIDDFSDGIITLEEAMGKASRLFKNFPNNTSNSSGNKKNNPISGGSYTSYNDYISTMQANSAAWTVTSSQTEKNRLHDENQKIGDKLGLSYDSTTGKWKKPDGTNAYASGTNNTKPGKALLGEIEPEIFIDNQGHLIPINQPTLANIGAGGAVFNQEQLANVRDLWDLSNLNISPSILPNVNTPNQSHTESYNLYGDIHLNGVQDANALLRQIIKRFKSV